MQASMVHENGPSFEFFRVVERRSPALASAHLLAGLAWCAFLPIGAAPEGGAFAVLALIALARLPATWQTYGRLFRSPVFLLYIALQGWQVLSNFWSVTPVLDWPDALFSRRLVALLALWPLASRWRLLLAAVCGGALLGAVAAVAAVMWHGRLALEAQDLLIARHRSSAGPIAAVGMVCAVACMFSARSWIAWQACLGAVALFAFQVCALAGRSPAIAAAVGVALVVLRAPNPPGAIKRRATIGALAVCAVVAGALLSGPLIARFSLVSSPAPEQDMPSITNVRTVLWKQAWERGFERPLIGHGANSWRLSVGADIAADPERYGVGAGQARRLSRGNHAHNTLLGAWYCTGAIGVALLLATVGAVVWSLWRAATQGWASAAALGFAGVYIAVGTFDDLGNVSVGSLMAALLVLIAVVNGRSLAAGRSGCSLPQTREAPR